VVECNTLLKSPFLPCSFIFEFSGKIELSNFPLAPEFLNVKSYGPACNFVSVKCYEIGATWKGLLFLSMFSSKLTVVISIVGCLCLCKGPEGMTSQ